MKKQTVYLCGAINGCTDAQCRDWRETAKSQLDGLYDCLDPMRRDYRGREDDTVRDIIDGDYADIGDSDIILAAADTPSWGTAMEIHHAFQNLSKFVIVVCGASRISPWLRGHAHLIVPTMDKALSWLKDEAHKQIGEQRVMG